MSDIIRLLPDSVANQIAAGEVIQRPASVIKELVENAVDAGATDIKIYIKDAGRTLIQVVDNGKGMSETDARMAFERHATSKIQAADDLFALHTMGFRGEALPSICAISQVELKTRTEDAAIGTRLVINATKVETQEPCVCDRGVNISVKNIFFNVPARRKFLKSDSVETSNVMREFERLALVNNRIRMSIDTGSRSVELRAASMKQRIGDIWKNNLDLHLLPIDINTSIVKITGFVSRPEYARRRNPLQYLIVNGRNMRHPYFHKAIMSCYEPLIAADTQPCYFLKFEVDPATIDVNIHPTKNEIKFEYEQQIWPILQASVKAALGKFGAVPSIDFNSDVLPVDPLMPGEMPEKPTLDIPDGYNPFKAEKESVSPINPFTRTSKNWDTLYADFMNGARGFSGEGNRANSGKGTFPSHIQDDENLRPAPSPKQPIAVESYSDGEPTGMDHLDETSNFMGDTSVLGCVGALCIQHDQKYIVTSSKDGLLIIDQYRAHLRILFEQYMQRIEAGDIASQGVMFPETLTLDADREMALEEVADMLAGIGFRVERLEGDSWKITGIPSMLKDSESRDVIMRILDSVIEGKGAYDSREEAHDGILRDMALVMARAAAIKGGRKLTSDEMEHIVSSLFLLSDPLYTPEGNLIYCRLEDTSIESMFR